MTKSLLTPVLPTFTEALVSSLNLPDDSHLSDAGLKTEVLKGRAPDTFFNEAEQFLKSDFYYILPLDPTKPVVWADGKTSYSIGPLKEVR